MDTTHRISFPLLCLAVVLVACGCSKTGSTSSLSIVSGSVEFKTDRGKPISLEGQSIQLFRVDGEANGHIFVGKIGEDNSFFVNSFDESTEELKPGIPEGEYNVVLKGKLIPKKYQDESTTDLKVTIQSGANALDPFVITRE